METLRHLSDWYMVDHHKFFAFFSAFKDATKWTKEDIYFPTNSDIEQRKGGWKPTRVIFYRKSKGIDNVQNEYNSGETWERKTYLF